MAREVKAGEATASRRRVVFQLVETDGITPALGEAGGQPQISVNQAAWTNTGIGVLSAIGNGRYHATLDAATVDTTGTIIESRYASSETAECPGDSFLVVSYDPYTGIGDVKAKTDLLGTGTALTVPVPLVPDTGAIHIRRGYDYKLADSRNLDIMVAVAASLAGAAVFLRLKGVTITGSVIGTGNEDAKQLRFQPTRIQSSMAKSGPYLIDASLANGNEIDLGTGTATVD